MQRSGFNAREDRLICLGDVCDRGKDVKQVFDTLLGLKHLVYILGNHDYWAREWALSGKVSRDWLFQGGETTMASYPDGLPKAHLNLLQQACNYFEEEGRLFVHGGIQPDVPLEEQSLETFLWDRSLIYHALEKEKKGDHHPCTSFREVFVGHTPTINFNSSYPIHACEIWLLDTGAGWGGPVTFMELESKEIFQSDPAERF